MTATCKSAIVFFRFKGGTFLARAIIQAKEKAARTTLGHATWSQENVPEAYIFQHFQCIHVLGSMKLNTFYVYAGYVLPLLSDIQWVIDQVRGKDGWILAKFFFACLWIETDLRSTNTQKKRMRPISSHLDRKNLVNKGFSVWLLGNFFLQDTAGSPERARCLHLACSGSQSQLAIWWHLYTQSQSLKNYSLLF